MQSFKWSFSDWCSKSTLLTDMVLMQYINVPFQLLLTISIDINFCLSILKRHINEYHEKMYVMMTMDMLHQKAVTWRNTLKECMRTFETLKRLIIFSCTASSDPFLIDAVYPLLPKGSGHLPDRQCREVTGASWKQRCWGRRRRSRSVVRIGFPLYSGKPFALPLGERDVRLPHMTKFTFMVNN